MLAGKRSVPRMSSAIRRDAARPTPPFHDIFDLDALADAPLHDAPYQYLTIPGFIRPAAFEAIDADFPTVTAPGPFDPSEHPGGPAFQHLLDALVSTEMASHFAARFGADIESAPTILKARRYDEPGGGAIHTDAKGKLVTVLVYLNRAWTEPGGRLRILRSGDDLDDYAEEVAPEAGTLVAFRRCDHSFHGYVHTPVERRMVQMNYVTPKKAARGHVDKRDRAQRANRVKRWVKHLIRRRTT
jgi:SM-20-related protein